MSGEEQQFEFDFEEGEYDSDLESVASDEEEGFSLEDWQSGLTTFDSFEFRYYTLRESVGQYQEDNELLVDTVLTAYRSHEGVTAIRLLADIYDLDNEENVRWSQNIRF